MMRQEMPISYDNAQLGYKLFLWSCGQQLREHKVSSAPLRPLPSNKEPIYPKKPPRRTKISVLFVITISQAFTYNGLSHLMEGVSSLLFLLCSATKHSGKCKALMLVTDRFITGNIVTTDFTSAWPSTLTLM